MPHVSILRPYLCIWCAAGSFNRIIDADFFIISYISLGKRLTGRCACDSHAVGCKCLGGSLMHKFIFALVMGVSGMFAMDVASAGTSCSNYTSACHLTCKGPCKKADFDAVSRCREAAAQRYKQMCGSKQTTPGGAVRR